ncbi:Sodium-dependent dicarboxylate transporter SdcS (plasmid) [Corynebacterium occultum]|uniref:Sodium-dependent dicarboxylate transporter SdcS n=1 Tax=Corynebacterium occultum TaxID=2675219 RepID=A0A6B8W0V1_9CORY|nr:DASS family sodium-coupled anion symporter [Corynebacterium occultum]QGU08789.1 Sodium-dependent dicarboxylate transporter SdcS [Corynebacterium occultum]
MTAIITREAPQSQGIPKKRPYTARGLALAAGPALALLTFVLLPDSLAMEPRLLAGVAILMAVWWMTEAIPIPATSLLPVILFPVLGIAEVGPTAAPYANSIVFLILGGTLLGLGVQKWELHRRIALITISFFGTKPPQIIFGLMVSSAFISAWVSNTATAVIMIPIALSIIKLVNEASGRTNVKFAASALLGVAYAITIGGFATLIGQPVNPLLVAYLQETFDITISFGHWMLLGIPFSVIFLVAAWFVLTFLVYRVKSNIVEGGSELFRNELTSLGKTSQEEKKVIAVFLIAVFGWLILPFIARIPQVAEALPFLGRIEDASIAVFVGFLLFLIPTSSEGKAKSGDKSILVWKDAVDLPWGVLLLIGGGMALSTQITGTGLAAWIGEQMSGLGGLPPFAILMVVTLVLILITELTSNTATAAAFFPVMGALAVGIGIDPLLMTVVVSMAIMCAFMLPVATPSNAVAFATGELPIRQMVRTGIWMNMLGLIITAAATVTLVPLVFGVSL